MSRNHGPSIKNDAGTVTEQHSATTLSVNRLDD